MYVQSNEGASSKNPHIQMQISNAFMSCTEMYHPFSPLRNFCLRDERCPSDLEFGAAPTTYSDLSLFRYKYR